MMQYPRRFLWVQPNNEGRPDVTAMRSHIAYSTHRDRRLTNVIHFNSHRRLQGHKVEIRATSKVYNVQSCQHEGDRQQHSTKSVVTQRRKEASFTAVSSRSQNSPSPTIDLWSLSIYRFGTYDHVQPNASHKLTIELDEYSHGMVKYLFTEWIPSLYPQKLAAVYRHRFFEMVHTDSMTCAIFLTYGYSRAAFELVQINGRRSLSCGDDTGKRYLFKYKETCLRMMREMFTTSWPASARTLYFASISLSGCAFIVNNPGEGCMHLQGAVSIAKAMGGFHKLDELGLEASLLWDIHLACLTGQKPTINDVEVAYVVERMLPQVPEWLEDSCLRFEALLGPSLRLDDNSNVCGALRKLFLATELINSYSIEKEDKINETLVIRTLFAGHKLSHCDPITKSTNITAKHNTSLLEGMRLAGMLVIFTTHLKATRKEDLFEKMSTSLEVQLRSSGPALETCWGQYPEIMMWIFFVGAYGSPDVARTLWFVENVRLRAHTLCINNWMQARSILGRFLYIAKEFDEAFEDLWISSQLGTTTQTKK